MKRVLITGAAGFIGSNLALALGRNSEVEIISVDINTPEIDLSRGLDVCDVVFHLAGTNRPKNKEEFETGNVESLALILSGLESRQRRPLIILSSSTQALLDNPYGESKLRAEELLSNYAVRTGTPARIFRLPGVFGKWSRPNYNSVVATFCYNISRDLPIQVTDPLREVELVHIDDVIAAFISVIDDRQDGARLALVSPTFRVSLGMLAEKLKEFRASRKNLHLMDLSDPFLRRLYATYMAYLPPDDFAYKLEPKKDFRGELAELLKTKGYGQIFLSRTNPGVTRGNHYHESKVEKFIVLEGKAQICFRHMSTGERVEYETSGSELEVVDIPPGWTHSIENIGKGEMIVLFWSSEVFDPARSDTYPAEVSK